MNHTETTSKESLLAILDLLDSLSMRYWVDGGWGVDVLIGRQTRTHRDVDIDFEAAFEKTLLAALEATGYRITTDWRPSRVELHHPKRGYIDIHPLHISESGSARQADLEGGWYHFKAEWFTTAVFEGRVIPCISAEAQRLFHSGYVLREVDKMDLANLDALDQEKYLEKVTVGERKPHNSMIVITEYNNAWPAMFEQEAARIKKSLGGKALQIHHAGSTAVPGLCAKPVIDLILTVADSSDESAYLPELTASGYTLHIREPDWFQHRLFKGPDADINLHVFSEDCPETERMLRFRDWLRNHEADRRLYAQTKRELARHTWKHVQNYADAKSAVVAKIMERALSDMEQAK